MTPVEAEPGRERRGARKPVKTTMADYAMSFEQLGQWMGERARSPTLRHPQATSLSMLDGAVAAVVAGPVSMLPEEWVCPLLGVDPDDFNHDTEDVLRDRRHAHAPQRDQRNAVDEAGELRATVRANAERRSRRAALVGKATGHPAAHKGGRIGGAASAGRSPESRSASAGKAAATRKRNGAHTALGDRND